MRCIKAVTDALQTINKTKRSTISVAWLSFVSPFWREILVDNTGPIFYTGRPLNPLFRCLVSFCTIVLVIRTVSSSVSLNQGFIVYNLTVKQVNNDQK